MFHSSISIMLLCVFICLFGFVSTEKVIIVGAGAAGIATASKLLENNITDFLILEAENRIGGRIHRVHFGNAFVDLGATFVHGEKGNVAYSLAKDYLTHNPVNDNTAFYFDGEKRTSETLKTAAKQLYDELAEHADSKDLSLGDVYLSRYNATILRKYAADSEMTRYAKNFIRVAEAAILSMESAFDWHDVIAETSFVEADGDIELSWNGLGYKTIFDILLHNFPNKTGYNIDNKILFGKTVTRIELNETSVAVKCHDGTHYSTEYVVFTPSIGVLKNNHKDIFYPSLDEDKVKAIENLGFGGIMSIAVEFNEAWWKNEKSFIFVWNDKDIEDLGRDIRYGPIVEDDHWLTWFTYIGTAPANPNVMIGWYSGPFVQEVEKLSKKQLELAISYTLHKHLGRDFNITKPINLIHSEWCKNTNFLGTYSYESVRMIKKNITAPFEILSNPVKGRNGKPRILFAGEATSSKRFATVDGAIGSGFREGNTLVDLLK